MGNYHLNSFTIDEIDDLLSIITPHHPNLPDKERCSHQQKTLRIIYLDIDLQHTLLNILETALVNVQLSTAR